MLSLLLLLLILWACFGFGAALLARLRATPDRLAEEAPFAIALGLGMLSYLVLAIGLLGQLHRWLGVALVVFLALLGWRHVLRLPGALLASLRVGSVRAASVLCGAFLSAMGLLTLLGALAPSTDGDYDALFYHLTLPKLYLLHGRISVQPWLTHSNFPFLLEMLYLLGLMLKGQILAKLFHFTCGWLTVLAIYSFGRRFFSPRAGLLGAVAFAAVPFVLWEMTSAYNELAFALYAFLALYALALWYQTRASGWLWISAILCGFALGTKLLALAVPAFIICALLLSLRREPKRGPALLRIAGFALLAAAVAAPWYVKSYLWTGNPVYPFFYEVFGGRYWTPTRAHEYALAQAAFGLGKGPLQLLLLPWNLTMHPGPFTDKGFSPVIASFGPLLFALLLPLILLRRVGPAGRLALGFAAFFGLLWFVMSQNSRYLIPVLPGLCAAVGLSADRLLARKGVTAAAVTAAYALTALIALGLGLLPAGPTARVALGLESQQDYLARTSPVYAIAQAVNEATPPSAKIMVLGNEPRMFYLDRDFLLGNHADIFTPQELASAPAFLAALRARGVTHVLLDPATMQNVRAHRGTMEPRLEELIAAHELVFVRQAGPMSLWEIVPARK